MIAWLNHRLHQAEDAQRAQQRPPPHAPSGSTRSSTRRSTASSSSTHRGEIEAFNRGAEDLFGYPESEVIGRNVSLLMPSPYHEEHDATWSAISRRARPGSSASAARSPDGGVTVRCFRCIFRSARCESAASASSPACCTTSPKRVHLEGQLGPAKRGGGRSSTPPWTASSSSTRTAASKRSTRRRTAVWLHGREVLGRNVDMLMPSPYHEEHDTYLSRYLATGRAKIIGSGREVQGLRKDGTTFPLHLSVGQITIGGERKFTGILHDLSGRVEMEAAVARAGGAGQTRRDGGRHRARGEEPAGRHSRSHSGIRQAYGPGRHAMRKSCKEIVSRIDSLDQMMKDLLLFARPPNPDALPTMSCRWSRRRLVC